jgi:hypothetical protein
MPCVRALETSPVVSSAKGSLLYWWLKVAVPKISGGRMEERRVLRSYGTEGWAARASEASGAVGGVVAMELEVF